MVFASPPRKESTETWQSLSRVCLFSRVLRLLLQRLASTGAGFDQHTCRRSNY